MALCRVPTVAIFCTLCFVLYWTDSTSGETTETIPSSNVQSKGLIVTTPRVWTTGTQEKVCIVAKGLNPVPFSCLVKLENPRNQSQNVITMIDIPPSGSACGDVYTPLDFSGLTAKLTVWIMKPHDYNFTKSSVISIQRAGHMTFIQTDKPMYKPSDLVRIRILTLKGKDLKILTDDISLAYVEDPTRTRVMQWTNISTINGLANLEMQLSDEPRLGEWTLKAIVLGETHSQKFTVAEYVLPKFEVLIHHPSYVDAKAEEMTWKVCARYTYGQPVSGRVNSSVCTKRWYNSKFCEWMNLTQLQNGCAKFSVNSSKLWTSADLGWKRSAEIFAKVEERGTSITLSSQLTVDIESPIHMVKHFPEDSTWYKPGLTYYGQGQVTFPDSSPVKEMDVHLSVKSKEEILAFNLTTDDNGYFNYFLPGSFTGRAGSSITEMVRLQTKTISRTLKSWYSPSQSYLQFEPFDGVASCKSVLSLPVQFISEQDQELTFYFQMITKGDIVHSGEVIARRDSLEADSKMLYKFNVNFTVTHLMSGLVRVLLFTILPNGETVADSMTVAVERCFENEVTMEFIDRQRQPGHSTTLRLAADPHSLCSISVVDKSMKLMDKQGSAISKSKVYEKLKTYDIQRTPYGRNDPSEEDCGKVELIKDSGNWMHRRKRMIFDSITSDYVDSKEAFMNSGMAVMSDLTIVTRPCKRRDFVYWDYFSERDDGVFTGLRGPMPMPMPMSVDREDSVLNNFVQKESSVLHRAYFPESWLWHLKSVGDSGTEDMMLNLPHTITEWIGDGFCTNVKSGLGITSQFSINAFQPFFMSFTLPYSMIRGERVGIPVSVFNYLSQCLKVTLIVEKSSAFELMNESPVGELRVCGQQTEIFMYYIVPRQLGSVNFTIKASSVAAEDVETNTIDERKVMMAEDIVTQKLLVEAEGKEEEETKSAFVCAPAEGSWMTELPNGIVEGSVRASTSIIGDVMGPTLTGLDSLLALPTGCGEQNMLKFSPNIFVMQYLQKTNSLTVSAKSKALEYLQTGYQRELTYRHNDGSYSAFGSSDKEGSTWLTAFVIKSFAQARPFIYIDQKDLDKSINWLTSIQLENGCFRQVGRVLDAGMKGGLADDRDNLAGLTAYVVVALMEAGISYDDPVILGAIKCLDIQSVNDTYTLSLMAYAYTMWNRNDTKQTEIMNRLADKATVADGMKYWKAQSPSTATEMTSYVLLAMLYGRQEEAVGEAIPIVRWLSSQRNSRGGFISTQDTVLALQALAQFAGLVHNDDFNAQIAISGSSWDHRVSITQHNRLLLQKKEGQTLPATLQYSANGTGCALIQATLKYNTLNIQRDPEPIFLLRVRVQRPQNNNCKERVLNICTRYNGQDNKTNMAIVSIKMVSGWIPDKDSIKKLKNNAKLQLKRHDIDKNTVQLYFDELNKVETCFSFSVHQIIIVTKTKPALVHVYDYYRPSLSAYADYSIASTCGTKEEIPRDGNKAQDKRNTTISQRRLSEPPRAEHLMTPSEENGAARNKSKKPTVVSCPVCNSENITAIRRKLCNASHGYVAEVVNRTMLKVQRVLEPSSNAELNDIVAKYYLTQRCSCSGLRRGSRVILLTTQRLPARSRQAVKLKLNTRVTVTEANAEVMAALDRGLSDACQ